MEKERWGYKEGSSHQMRYANMQLCNWNADIISHTDSDERLVLIFPLKAMLKRKSCNSTLRANNDSVLVKSIHFDVYLVASQLYGFRQILQFIPTPFRLLWEAFTLQLLRENYSVKYPPLARYPFIFMSELWQRGINESAKALKRQQEDSNPGSID